MLIGQESYILKHIPKQNSVKLRIEHAMKVNLFGQNDLWNM